MFLDRAMGFFLNFLQNPFGIHVNEKIKRKISLCIYQFYL